MDVPSLSADDLRLLARRGISEGEAQRQLALLSRPPVHVEVVRPCTVGDGVMRLSAREIPELHSLHEAAAAQGRFVKFVPASGAASRMFKSLLHFQQGEGRESSWTEIVGQARRGATAAAELVRFCDELARFPFYDDLKEALASRGEDLDGLARVGAFQPVLDALLGPSGLAYADQPKGLLKFHRYRHETRTAFDEHLAEAAELVRDRRGVCRLHLTVSPEHRAGFRQRLAQVEASHAARHDTSFDVTFSVQKPSTDTLALDACGLPLRDARGELVLRPGGHGALIENLNDLGADLIFVKNIDNVQPEARRQVTLHWKRTLGGLAVRLAGRVAQLVEALGVTEPGASRLDEAEGFLADVFDAQAPAEGEIPSRESRRARLLQRLNRPVRVCGVVAHTGEPGGGPFWVRDADGCVRRQLVETAEIDPDDADAQCALGAATHFNPVDLVCAVRDWRGEAFDLVRFVDPRTAMVATKSAGGRDLRALERPGLWNGAMAGWNTAFVEVPIETFSPVKTVFDLLREDHRP